MCFGVWRAASVCACLVHKRGCNITSSSDCCSAPAIPDVAACRHAGSSARHGQRAHHGTLLDAARCQWRPASQLPPFSLHMQAVDWCWGAMRGKWRCWTLNRHGHAQRAARSHNNSRPWVQEDATVSRATLPTAIVHVASDAIEEACAMAPRGRSARPPSLHVSEASEAASAAVAPRFEMFCEKGAQLRPAGSRQAADDPPKVREAVPRAGPLLAAHADCAAHQRRLLCAYRRGRGRVRRNAATGTGPIAAGTVQAVGALAAGRREQGGRVRSGVRERGCIAPHLLECRRGERRAAGWHCERENRCERRARRIVARCGPVGGAAGAARGGRQRADAAVRGGAGPGAGCAAPAAHAVGTGQQLADQPAAAAGGAHPKLRWRHVGRGTAGAHVARFALRALIAPPACARCCVRCCCTRCLRCCVQAALEQLYWTGAAGGAVAQYLATDATEQVRAPALPPAPRTSSLPPLSSPRRWPMASAFCTARCSRRWTRCATVQRLSLDARAALTARRRCSCGRRCSRALWPCWR